MHQDVPLGLIVLLWMVGLYVGVHSLWEGWRFWKKGIYTLSFSERWMLERLRSTKGEEAAERYRSKVESLSRKRLISFVNLVAGAVIVLVVIVGVIVILMIQPR
jgi:hypothetical protein